MTAASPHAITVDVGIIAADVDGTILYASPCALVILRQERSLVGEGVQTALALPSSPMSMLRGRDEWHGSHWLQAQDSNFEIDLTIALVRATSGETAGYYFVFHDRSQENRLELEQRRFERLAAMGTMVAGFAHEIRNPMASLRSIAESLGEELAETNLHLPHVGRMLSVLERVERLVRNSLLFGRPSPPRRDAHRPWELVSKAVADVGPRTRGSGGALRLEVDEDLPLVFVDDGQLVQILVVLLNNALDAARQPARVLLRAHYPRVAERGRRSEPPPSPFLRFEVHDDGPGMAPEVLPRIFDPFFTTKASGTGLGLSIAQQLITENGGRIEVSSSLGGPTVFTVFVPIGGLPQQRQGGSEPDPAPRSGPGIDMAAVRHDRRSRQEEPHALERSSAAQLPQRRGVFHRLRALAFDDDANVPPPRDGLLLERELGKAFGGTALQHRDESTRQGDGVGEDADSQDGGGHLRSARRAHRLPDGFEDHVEGRGSERRLRGREVGLEQFGAGRESSNGIAQVPQVAVDRAGAGTVQLDDLENGLEREGDVA